MVKVETVVTQHFCTSETLCEGGSSLLPNFRDFSVGSGKALGVIIRQVLTRIKIIIVTTQPNIKLT